MSQGQMLWEFANGIYSDGEKGGAAFFQGMMHHSNTHRVKGIGNSGTIAYDLDTIDLAHQALLSLSETVGLRLREQDFCSKVVYVSYTTNDFVRESRQKKFYAPTNSTKEIYDRACEIFDTMWRGEPIRAIGVHATCLTQSDAVQTNMFYAESQKRQEAEASIDAVRQKYGHMTVMRGCFVDGHINPMLGGTWGNGNHKKIDPRTKKDKER